MKVKTEVKSEILDDITIKDSKHRRVVSSADAVDRKFKRTVLCVAKPSYLLSLIERSSTRSSYLKRLPKILSEMLRQRNWREASGVLSVLMQGTMRDASPSMNRLKYEVLSFFPFFLGSENDETSSLFCVLLLLSCFLYVHVSLVLSFFLCFGSCALSCLFCFLHGVVVVTLSVSHMLSLLVCVLFGRLKYRFLVTCNQTRTMLRRLQEYMILG